MTFLNEHHPNIKSTIEKEKKKQLPSLDILNDSSRNSLATSVYRKSTYTRLLVNSTSFTSPNYKRVLLKHELIKHFISLILGLVFIMIFQPLSQFYKRMSFH